MVLFKKSGDGLPPETFRRGIHENMSILSIGRHDDKLSVFFALLIGVKHRFAHLGRKRFIILRVQPQRRDRRGFSVLCVRFHQPRLITKGFPVYRASAAIKINNCLHAGRVCCASCDNGKSTRRHADQHRVINGCP